MMLNIRPLFIILFALTACSGNAGKIASDSLKVNQTDKSAMRVADSIYMPTGFYYLATEDNGIKMRLRGSDSSYSIAPTAFASVKNIIGAQLIKTPAEKGIVYTDLCMTFDKKGTKDLEEGTSNLLHTKLAVIVANQLLYVVDNNAKVTTGVMHVLLLNYSEPEMKDLQNAVNDQK